MKAPRYPLPTELLEATKVLGELRRFEAGDLLIREGDVSNCLYVLLSGELKVFTHNKKGRELVYNTLSAGECFGELALDGQPRSASVRALSEGECVAISGEHTRSLFEANPDFVFHVVVNLISLLRRATHQLKIVALEDVYGRILDLIREEAIETEEMRRLPQELTQQEIANRIGSSREMVSHVIRDLARGGYVRKSRRHGLILQKDLPGHR